MRFRSKEPLVLLLIFLALALPGAQGANFSGSSNGESISANVHASTDSVAGVAYGRGDFHFYGDGDAKYSRKYSTGTTWSQAGVVIKDASNYDGHIGGGKDTKAKATNAYVDLLAEDAEYISVYGKSGTSKNVGTGVELTVEDGSADVLVATSADGKNPASESHLQTNEEGDNAILGSGIAIKGYYTGSSKGQVTSDVEDGSIENYNLLAQSKSGAGAVMEGSDSIFGDYVNLAASSKKTASGVTKEMKQGLEVYDGYINGFYGSVDDRYDNWEGLDYYIYQGFKDAGTASINEWDSGLYASTTYTETSKNSKIKAEQNAYLQNGVIFGDEEKVIPGFESGADSEGVWQWVNHADGDYISFEDRFTSVDKKATKKTSSTATINEGNIDGYSGAAGPSGSIGGPTSGSVHYIDRAQGESIYLDNIYQDNLGPKGGFGKTHLSLGDPAAQINNGDLIGSIEDYVGEATFIADAKTVRSQGYTNQLNVNAEARAYYNQLAEDSYSAGDWENYFITEAKSSSPWTVSVDTGCQVRGEDTIQNAINTMPYGDGNIYLLPSEEKVYKEHDIVNNANENTADGEVGFTLWGAGSYMDVWGPAPNYRLPASNSVIDADIDGDGSGDGGIFVLLALNGPRTFSFKNIDFNNGNSVGGGAIATIALIEGMTTNIENSNFNNNYALIGGAIGNMFGTMNIKDCNFNSNWAALYGGAIVNTLGIANIEGCTFNDNKAEEEGGAIESALGTLNIEGSAFNDNKAEGAGGAINSAFDTLNIKNSEFNRNWAATQGGAIVSDWDEATIEGSTFNDNKAEEVGGAIESSSGTLNIKNNEFNRNWAALYGGAIDNNQGTVTIEGSTFNDNKVEGAGGAIATALGTLNIKSSDFNRNWAYIEGGAIDNGQGTVIVEDSDLTDNHASYGGAITSGDKYNYGPNGGSISFDGCTFTRNHADIGYGGAIVNDYFGYATTAPISTANDCTFDGNTAAQYGGAYAAHNFAVGPNTAGTANTITNSDFKNNIASGLGAAIYIENPSTNTLLGNIYTGNLPAGHDVDIV